MIDTEMTREEMVERLDAIEKQLDRLESEIDFGWMCWEWADDKKADGIESHLRTLEQDQRAQMREYRQLTRQYRHQA